MLCASQARTVRRRPCTRGCSTPTRHVIFISLWPFHRWYTHCCRPVCKDAIEHLFLHEIADVVPRKSTGRWPDASTCMQKPAPTSSGPTSVGFPAAALEHSADSAKLPSSTPPSSLGGQPVHAKEVEWHYEVCPPLRNQQAEFGKREHGAQS